MNIFELGFMGFERIIGMDLKDFKIESYEFFKSIPIIL
jgi:hypothetical protein